jgi:hypothetical protein
MPSSLSSLLADKLGLSEDHARRLLERLAHTIRDHADASGVHVSGLGTFRDQDGTLTFEPADRLARRVNHRFEGLDAEPAASAPDGASARFLTPLVTDTRPELPPDAPSLHAPEEPPSIPPAVWRPQSAAQETPAAPASSTSEDSPPSSETDTAAQRRPSRPDRDRSAGPRIAAAVLAALFLLSAGWLVLGHQGLVPTPHSVLSEQTEPPPSSGPDETSRAARPPADTADTTTASQDTTAAADTTAEAPRWALVVASRNTRAAAEDQADTFRVRLSNLSLPINIRTAETDNTTRHRVVVGDFSSKEAALEAMDEHQSVLPEGVWLLRLE